MTSFDYDMFSPMATLTNELAWRGMNDRPATRQR